MGHFHQRPLGVAVDEDIGLGIEQDGATDSLGPVVVVGDAAQGCLDAADNDGDLLEGLLAALGIDQGGAIRPLAAHIPGV